MRGLDGAGEGPSAVPDLAGGRVATSRRRQLIELPVRPLLLTAGEQAADQRARFLAWHAGALEAGLAQWIDFL